MKVYINKNILHNFLINFVFLFILEIIFKIVNSFNLLDWSTLRISIFLLIISLIISNVEYFLPKIFSKIINIFIILVFSLYAYLQTGFNNFIGVYMSLGASSQFGAVVDYVKEFILSFKWYYYFNLLPIILIIIYYIFFYKKIYKKFEISNESIKYKSINVKVLLKKAMISIISLIVFIGVYISTLYIPFMQNKLQSVSNKELFLNPSVPSVSIKEFGISTFGILDLKNYFFPQAVVEQYIFKNENNKKSNLDQKQAIDNDKWNDIIANEKDNILNTLNNYFINNNVSSMNDYTGLFKNKNLIVIMMESVNDIIINEEYYPNFYKLYSEGWHWENNFSPRNSCSTGNNEMSGMIGLYSIYNTCTANKYQDNTYFESIFNLFNDQKYSTFSAHDYTEHYYARNTIHTNMGSNKYYGVEDLGIDYSNEYKNWASDEDFMTEVINILKEYKKKKFMSWLTTVSSHQPYYSSKEGDMYLSLFKDLNVKSEVKRYMSKLKILDNALGILLNGLDDLGILDDTVIVLFGDHYPYGLSDKMINSVLDYDVSEDNDRERVPFVIYNTSLESKVFEEYTSYINIVPTIANLFDLKYDPRLYVGNDILSDNYQSLTVFADSSWKNEIAYYNAAKGKIKYYTDKEYSVDEIKEINDNIENKINMSSLAIKNNYFNYLYNKLNNISEDETDNKTYNDKES